MPDNRASPSRVAPAVIGVVSPDIPLGGREAQALSIIVLCPTRGRPARAAEALASFRGTVRRPSSRLVFVIDRDDERLGDYLMLGRGWTRRYGIDGDVPYFVVLTSAQSGNLVKATNAAAPRFWDRADILGHVGDDHIFRTDGWDAAIEAALEAPGVAYGDDGFQGAAVPTAAFISSVIVRALGWLALPTCDHLFIDTAWKVLGEQLGSIHYLPQVSIEHMHPAAGKAPTDDGYERANSQETWNHDRAAFETWMAGSMGDDIARVKAALA